MGVVVSPQQFFIAAPPSSHFPLLQCGCLPQGTLLYELLQGWVLHGLQYGYLLWCLEHLFPSILSHISVYKAAFTFSPQSLAYVVFLSFHEHIFTYVPPLWLLGLVVPRGGTTGASWNQLAPSIMEQPQPLLTEASL